MSAQDLLTNIRTASETPARQRQVKPDHSVREFCGFAFENGLDSATIDQAVALLSDGRGYLDQSYLLTVTKSLYPRETVSDDTIYKVVGCLGQGAGKPNAAIQNALLRWLVMVYDILEHPSLLAKFYSVLFNLLDMISIRASICHLLSLITRRKHVRPFRIQILLELLRTVGSELPLVGLLRVFKDYYPDIILHDTTKVKVFHYPDAAWRQRLSQIQQNSGPQSTRRREAIRARRARSALIPELRTSRATESSTTLEEVENVDDFIQKIDRVELPNQVISILGDPLVKKLLNLAPPAVALKRLDNWLSVCFSEELEFTVKGDQTTSDRLSDVLECLSRGTLSSLPACQTFLERFLPIWNGTIYASEILQLASAVPPSNFKVLHANLFIHVENAMLGTAADAKERLLEFYMQLLKRWTRYSTSSEIEQLITHTDTLCLSILDSDYIDIGAASTILRFWETVTLVTREALTPSALVVYLVFLGVSSISTSARLCTVLVAYKQVFEKTSLRGDVDLFNGYLMDVCNCLWRNRGLNVDDANALGCGIPKGTMPSLRRYADSVANLPLSAMFSLSHSVVFVALSIATFREIEDAAADEIEYRHAGPITQRSLASLASEGGVDVSWPAYRLEVLRWLEERGVKGTGQLMYNTMKQLLDGRGREIGAHRLPVGVTAPFDLS